MRRLIFLLIIVAACATSAYAQEDPCNPDPTTCVIVNVQTDNPVLTGKANKKFWVGPNDMCQPVDPEACAEAVGHLQLISGVPYHSPVQEYIVDGLAKDCEKNAVLGFGCTAAQHKALGK